VPLPPREEPRHAQSDGSRHPFRAAIRSEPGGDLAVIQLQDAARAAHELGESVPRLCNRDNIYDKHLLKHGDVLIQARGFRNPAAVVAVEFPAISAPGLHVLRPDPEQVLPEYLAWCLNHSKTQAVIASVAQGSHAPFIAKQTLARVQIPVPPLPVQAQIVGVDQLRRQQRQVALELVEERDLVANERAWQAAIAMAKPST
jgi:hypothetical protein